MRKICAFLTVLALLPFTFSCEAIDNQKQESIIIAPNQGEKSVNNSNNNFEKPTAEPQVISRDLLSEKALTKKTKVALMLPLTGKYKDLGEALLNAATISVFENDLNSSVELVVFDSKETPQDAKKAFEEIISSQIKVVIGPIFSPSVEAISKDAVRNKITVISLSNNQMLSEKITADGGVFLAGVMPEAQIDKIVSYSRSKAKLNYAIIAPSNEYGNAVTLIFKKIIQSRDLNFVTGEFYKNSPSDEEIDRVVNRVINSFSISNQVKNRKNYVVKESDRSYAQVIFVPESGKVLSKIVASIKKQNVDERDFLIVGSSQWDDESTLSDVNLHGSLFVAPQNQKFQEFSKNYYQNFQKFPPRISAIVYDLVASAIKVAESKNGQNISAQDFIKYTEETTSLRLPKNVASKNAFEGIDGLFRFLPNGIVQRNLVVLSVDSGKFSVVDDGVENFLRYRN